MGREEPVVFPVKTSRENASDQAGLQRVFSDGWWGSGVAGAKASSVGWDGAGSPFDSNDAEITHEVVDRPSQKKRILSREYVQ